jgi:hypothetical protein
MTEKQLLNTSQLTAEYNVPFGCTRFSEWLVATRRILNIDELAKGARPRLNKLFVLRTSSSFRPLIRALISATPSPDRGRWFEWPPVLTLIGHSEFSAPTGTEQLRTLDRWKPFEAVLSSTLDFTPKHQLAEIAAVALQRAAPHCPPNCACMTSPLFSREPATGVSLPSRRQIVR